MTVDFPEPEPPALNEQNVENLAAIRAALDPARRDWRNDVLVTAIVEILSRRGSMPLRLLVDALNAAWRTSAITDGLVTSALAVAYEANLVRTERELTGQDLWSATDAAAAEAEQDRRFATSILEGFTQAVAERLSEFPDERVSADDASRVAAHAYAAIAEAAAGLYGVEPPTVDGDRLRPVTFDLGALRRYAPRVEPKTRRQAVLDVALSAIDPDDSFGNDVVRLVTVGNLLHGGVTRRDVATRPNLVGHRLLLDTTVLVDLVDHGTSQQRLARSLTEQSRRLGVEVFVAEHTIDEWERVWQAAEGEARAAALPDRLAPNISRLAGNPFARMWLRSLEADPSITWQRFRRDRSDVRRRLANLGVRTRPHGNNLPADQQVAESIRDRLLSLSNERQQRYGRPARSRRTATADGNSCAMIARWRGRADTGAQGAYFVSHETLTNRAYADLYGDRDQVPLVVTPASWMVYVSSLATDDPLERSRVAEMVSDATIRSTFFGMAVGYTIEEALELSDQLCNNCDALSADDTRTALQLNLLDLMDESADDASPAKRAAIVTQRRNARQQARIRRQQGQLDETVARIERTADERVARAEGRAEVLETDRKVAQKRGEQLEGEAQAERLDKERLQRVIRAGAAGIGAAVLLLLSALGSALNGPAIVLAVGLLLHYAYNARDYVNKGGSGWAVFWWAVGELGAVLVVDVAASAVF